MNKMEFRDFLLTTLPEARLASGGSQLVCLCPLCGDTSGHCYVGPFDEDDTPIMYNCFKCNPNTQDRSGFVNQAFMNRYNAWLPDEFNNRSKGTAVRKKRISGRTVFNIEHKYLTESEETAKKLSYINWRLGLNLSFADTIRLKLILNISDLLNGNQIYEYTRSLSDMHLLDHYFMGAIGVNNNMLSMRNMYLDAFEKKGVKTGLLAKKYINYVVNPNMEADKFYVIPTAIDTLQPVNIHVCEGFFDALGIYYNLYDARATNSLFVAGFGKSYEECVTYFLTRTPIVNVNVHLYPDADVPDYALKKSINTIKPCVDSICIHRNVYEDMNGKQKDFGVPKNLIRDSCTKIF